MQLGFNENIVYRGDTYHIQTEDGGIYNPVITTILFKGGNIAASKRIKYDDIIKFEKLNTVIKELMKEQHGGMLRDLKEGVFDEEPIASIEPLVETAKNEEETDAAIDPEKGLDDIILESLSINEEDEE